MSNGAFGPACGAVLDIVRRSGFRSPG